MLQNAMALWTLQFFRKTIPLITIPYLARVLGPEGWGLVAIFQSLAEVIAGVPGAQAMLAAGALNLLLVFLFVPPFAHVGMAWAVLCSKAFVCATLLYLAVSDPRHAVPAACAGD